MTYGAYVGTGFAGGGFVATSLFVGGTFMWLFAILLVVAVGIGVLRRARRTGAHQRP